MRTSHRVGAAAGLVAVLGIILVLAIVAGRDRPPPLLSKAGSQDWGHWIGPDGSPKYIQIASISPGDDESVEEVAALLDVLHNRWRGRSIVAADEDIERFFLTFKALLVSPACLSESWISEALLAHLSELEWSEKHSIRARAKQLRWEYEAAKSKYDRRQGP